MTSRAASDAALDAIVRIERPALVATVARMVRDVGLAEELAQDAIVTALERWRSDGVPDNPGAWLVTTAKRRAIDALRHRTRVDRKHDELAANENDHSGFEPEALDDRQFGDDLLRLVFVSCHPVLAVEARVALTLRLLCGLTTDEIARAFLVPEPTIAQRIVRAKRLLADKQVPFEVPGGDELRERLAAVLEVVYLVFNEGYTATTGDDWTRPELCADAMRLGRTLAQLAPGEPDIHGLLALMELQASRLAARRGARGEVVLLLDQDRLKWDRLLIQRGLAALERAEALGGARRPYVLQAAIAACHARATTPGETDWQRIVTIYEQLAEVTPSPIVELNRAVAVAMLHGAAAGLALVDQLAAEPALERYHLLPSVRADLLIRLGRVAEARAELARAIELTANTRERELLEARLAALAGGVG